MRAVRSRALLLRTVPYGDSDLILTLLTEAEGRLGARFRGGRKSSRRAAGGVEPFHTLEVMLEDRGGDLLTLKETRLVTVRAGLAASLEAMESAGTALRWARHLLPTRHAEPAAWGTLIRLLDALDREGALPRGALGMAGFHLLSSVGYALDLARCIVCGRACPPGVSAYIDASRGGIVCRSCGGQGRRLDGPVRELAARAQRADDGDPDAPVDWLTPPAWLTPSQASDLLAVLADAMAAHTGLDPSK